MRSYLPLLLALWALPARAQPALSLEASMGFDGVASINRMAPIQVTLANRGEPLQGRLTMEVSGGMSRWVYTREVTLGRRSNKRYGLYVRPILGKTNLELRLETAAGVLGRVSRPLRALSPYEAPQRLLVTVGPRMGAGSLEGLGFQGLLAVPLEASALPDRWYGYEGVSALLLSALDPASLEPEQVKALLDWVSWGGRLVIWPGEEWRALAGSPLGGLLPLAMEGLEPLPLAHGPVTMAIRGRLVQGAVVHSLDGIPVVAQAPVGEGSVTLVGVNPATLPPWQAGEIWETFLEREVKEHRPEAHQGEMTRLLSKLSSMEPLPLSWVLGLGVLYLLCLGPVDYLLLRRLRRPSLHWATFLAFIGLFSAVTYTLSAAYKSKFMILQEVQVLWADPQQEARGTTVAGLYVPGRRMVTFRCPLPSALVEPYGSIMTEELLSRPGSSHQDDEGMEITLPAQHWSMVMARSRWVTGLRGGIEREGDRLVSTLPLALRDVMVVSHHRAWHIPKLGPGAAVALGEGVELPSPEIPAALTGLSLPSQAGKIYALLPLLRDDLARTLKDRRDSFLVAGVMEGEGPGRFLINGGEEVERLTTTVVVALHPGETR